MSTVLDVHSWLVVITFMVVIIIVIHPIRLPLPIPTLTSAQKTQHDQDLKETNKQSRTLRFPYSIELNIATAPVIGVLFLLATLSIGGDSVRDGIVGAPDSGVEPYAVMILFFSLAYICISLDMTGVFQYAAFWISKRGGGGGQRIFLSFFLLSTVMAGLTSNDVVVLTMTPFLVYYSHAVNLVTPVAFLMAEIQTANIASMALYIGNLTNVVACQAYKISFLEYSAWMLLPCFASIAACYVMLRLNFRGEQYIPSRLQSPNIDPRSCLIDPWGAVFGLSVLACSLICLIGTSFAHVSVWIVTGPFALLTLARDMWYDWQGKFKGLHTMTLTLEDGGAKELNVISKKAEGGTESRLEQGLPVFQTTITGSDKSSDGSSTHLGANSAIADTAGRPELEKARSSDSVKVTTESNNVSGLLNNDHAVIAPTANDSNSTEHHPNAIQKFSGAFERRLPLLHAIAIRMPWAILPFTFSMFILVEGLSHTGWIGIFASWATHLVPNYIAATYAIGFISVLLCNIFNNVPMTILVARILQHPEFVNSPLATPEVVKGCLFALIVGSNLGACTTLISSLAGLMWDSVLRNKNAGVGFWGFLRWNMGVMPVVIFVALSVVVAELAVIF
ncbi:hypothetical protein BGZ54_002352 [Gamsiella multidivaricata]|nr:hypothetical protein BGZ54_002352 [Gamsiella multidivaricata]